MEIPGSRLMQLIRAHAGQLTIVSPFVKAEALERVMDLVPEDSIRLFTRWLPAEVAVGVSDLEVFELLHTSGRGDVFLLRELHAKAYLRGDRALVGSANLTKQGMGWAEHANLEVLVEVPSTTDEVAALMGFLERYALRASAQVRDVVREAAQNMAADPEGEGFSTGVARRGDAGNREGRPWIPACTAPRRLFSAYLGDETTRRMLDSTVEDARADLRYLQLPKRLTKVAFVAHVRAMLTQSTVYCVVDRALGASPPRHLPEALAEELLLEDAEESQEVTTRVTEWLLHFFPERFRLVAPSESMRIVKSRQVD